MRFGSEKMIFEAMLTDSLRRIVIQIDVFANLQRFFILKTLIFAIPYSVFEGFSKFNIIAYKMLPKSLLWSENVPRWL